MPDDATDTYTIGLVEYARPDIGSDYGGGVTVNNFLWRKENEGTVTKTIAEVET